MKFNTEKGKNMFYKKDYKTRMSDFDRNGKLSYEAIIEIIETAGSNHSDSVNDNVIEGSRNGAAWILADWSISILNRVDNINKVTVTTWIRKTSSLATVFRNFIIADENGNEIVKAEGKSCLLDMRTGRLERISEELVAAYEPEEKCVFETALPRLRAPKEYTIETPLHIRRDDIDFNGHVHNTRYMSYAVEALPPQVYKADDLHSVRIIYSKPVKENTKVIAKYAPTEDGHFVGIYSDGVLCTLIELK